MTSIGIGIVAHVKRYNAARTLRTEVGAQCVSWDYGCLGASANHLSVWRVLADLDTEWSIVLEDDALPVKDFRTEVAKALDVAPTPVVSLYLGTGSPKCWQTHITRGLAQAQRKGAHWLVCRNMLHAVGIAIRTPLVPNMIRGTQWRTAPIDERITAWSVKTLGTQHVSYPVPSLVDHADWPTLINHPDGQRRVAKRVAHQCGTRDKWNDRAIPIAL